MSRSGFWTLLLTTGVAVLAAVGFADTGPGKPASAGPSSAVWDRSAALQFLDTRAGWWLGSPVSSRGAGTTCISCHTSAPIAMALASLGSLRRGSDGDATQSRLIDRVKVRVADWSWIDSVPPTADVVTKAYSEDQKAASLGTESVLNALLLADYDTSKPGGRLSSVTQQALVYLEQQQQPDGSWRWLQTGLKPSEEDGVYYGDCLAAIAIGMAGRTYYTRSDIAPHVVAMARYLKSNFVSRPVHDQVCCLWASTWLPGLITGSSRAQLIATLLKLQESDGGWSMGALGQRSGCPAAWKSYGVYPAGAISDGYATGLVVLALERAGVPRGNLQLSKGITWLESNERSGAWPAAYVNAPDSPESDANRFVPDISAAYAVLALTEQEAE